MVMKIDQNLRIDDLRNHSVEQVETLRQLLAGGARVEADAKRPGFYEVENHSEVYYIHLSPITGRILLLASWPKEEGTLEGPLGSA